MLAAILPEPVGNIAASALASWGPNAATTLVAACRSTNALQRINTSSALRMVRDRRVSELLPTLFKDDRPEVRFSALLAADLNWDPQFIKPLIALFRDPYLQIRRQATQCLCLNEPSTRARAYFAVLRDPNPDVQLCAFNVLSEISVSPIPTSRLVADCWRARGWS